MIPENGGELPAGVFFVLFPALEAVAVKLAAARGDGLLLFVFALLVVLEGDDCWKVAMGSYSTLPSRRLVMVRSTLSVVTGGRIITKCCTFLLCDQSLAGKFVH